MWWEGKEGIKDDPQFLNWACEWTVMLNSFRHVESEVSLGPPRWRSLVGFCVYGTQMSGLSSIMHLGVVEICGR